MAISSRQVDRQIHLLLKEDMGVLEIPTLIHLSLSDRDKLFVKYFNKGILLLFETDRIVLREMDDDHTLLSTEIVKALSFSVARGQGSYSIPQSLYADKGEEERWKVLYACARKVSSSFHVKVLLKEKRSCTFKFKRGCPSCI